MPSISTISGTAYGGMNQSPYDTNNIRLSRALINQTSVKQLSPLISHTSLRAYTIENTENKEGSSGPILKVKSTRNNLDIEGPNVSQSLAVPKGSGIISGSFPVVNNRGSFTMESTASLPQLSSQFVSRKNSQQPSSSLSHQALLPLRKSGVFGNKKSLMAVDQISKLYLSRNGEETY